MLGGLPIRGEPRIGRDLGSSSADGHLQALGRGGGLDLILRAVVIGDVFHAEQPAVLPDFGSGRSVVVAVHEIVDANFGLALHPDRSIAAAANPHRAGAAIGPVDRDRKLPPLCLNVSHRLCRVDARSSAQQKRSAAAQGDDPSNRDSCSRSSGDDVPGGRRRHGSSSHSSNVWRRY